MKTVIFRFNGGLFVSGEKDDFKPRCGARFLLRELKKRQIELLPFLKNEELYLNQSGVDDVINNFHQFNRLLLRV